jgi:hypothetical protein
LLKGSQAIDRGAHHLEVRHSFFSYHSAVQLSSPSQAEVRARGLCNSIISYSISYMIHMHLYIYIYSYVLEVCGHYLTPLLQWGNLGQVSNGL